MNRHKLIVLALFCTTLAITLLVANTLLSRLSYEKQVKSSSSQAIQNDIVAYSGKDGVDALSLLKDMAVVKQNPSGLVVEINNRKADSNKKEYWAFYINEKLSSVAPSEYKTHKSDRIIWKIDHF